MNRHLSAVIRRACGQSGKPYPIVVIEGDSEPRLVGESWHHVTPGGTRVRYPNAYKRKAFSTKLIYVPSSLRIEVGETWVRRQQKAGN